ncbi:MAG: anhydro-N-acetylmuramic acid kinase [Rhodospirillales bacterium]
MSGRVFRALGLMSGTSADGVDAAVIETDGARVTGRGPSASFPYNGALAAAVRGLYGRAPAEGDGAAAETARELTDAHADAVIMMLAKAGVPGPSIDIIGFHGQTVWHDPAGGVTVQLGDGQRLADETGRPVIADFRSADIAAGGQGAPLAPLYHAALAADLEKPLCVLNIGGVANVTVLNGAGDKDEGGGDNAVAAAFDVGPGNALIDDWMRAHGLGDFDRDGALAAQGRVDEAALSALLEHPYFDAPPPKSLDRQAFSSAPVEGLSPADGAATLTAFTARAAARALAHIDIAPARWIITGGGRSNPVLMAMLKQAVGAPLAAAEDAGWDGDMLEAEAFAFLAVRSVLGLPLSLPQTTGAAAPTGGGTFFEPSDLFV